MEKIERTKKDCAIKDSNLCIFAGSEGCEECFASHPGSLDPKQAAEDWEITLSYLPENMDDIHLADHCWFCKGEKKGPKDLYAILDMGHPEPEHKRGMFFGFGKKVRTPVGSMVQVPVGICKACRNRFRTKELIKWLCPIIGIALAFGIVAIPAVGAWLAGISPYLPLGVLIGVSLLGWGVGIWISKLYMQVKSKETEFDPYNLPIISAMKWKGWSGIMEVRGVPQVSFAKEKPRPHILFRKEETEKAAEEGED